MDISRFMATLMIKNKSGFVLIFNPNDNITLLSAYYHSFIGLLAHKSLAMISLEKEQAKILALGGIQIAISELTYTNTANAEVRKARQSNVIANFFSIKRVATFEFTTNSDGFDGKLQIYISCEQAK